MHTKKLFAALTAGAYLVPLITLLFYHRTIYPFLTIKIPVFTAVIFILFLLWLLLVIKAPEYRPRLSRIHAAVIALVGIYTLTSLLGVDVHRSLWSSQARGIGLVMLYSYYAYYLILITILKRIQPILFLKWNVLVAGLVALSAVIQRFAPTIFYVTEGSRPGGVLGNPAYISSYLVLALFLGLWLTLRSFSERTLGATMLRWFYALGLSTFVIATALVLANTRGALLAIVVASFGILCVAGISRFRTVQFYKNYSLLAAILLVLVAGSIIATPRFTLWQSIPGLNRLSAAADDASIDNRIATWKIALRAAADRPILGWGLENFKYGFDTHYDPTLFRSGFGDTYFDKPHNVPLEMLTTGGLVGFAAYVWLIFAVSRAMYRKHDRLERLFLFGAGGAYLIQSAFIFETFGSYLLLVIATAYLDDEPYAFTVFAQKVKNSLAIVWITLCLVMITFGTYQSVQIWRSNRAQYETLNYFASYVHDQISNGVQNTKNSEDLLNRAFIAYEAGARIQQPYYTDFVHNFMTGISDTIQQSGLPDASRFIDRALKDYEVAIQAESLDYFNHVARADARTVFARINPRYLIGAEQDLVVAERLSPRRQQTRFVAAKIKLLLHDIEGTFAEMEKAVNLDPEAGEPHFYLGLIALQVGRTDRAFAEIEQAAKLGRVPKNAQEFRILGGAYGDKGEYDKAFEYFSGAVAFTPDDLESRMKLGMSAYYIGKNDIAKQQFEYVLPRVPEFKNTANYQELRPIFDQLGIQRSL